MNEKVVFVTGASRGIGLAACRALAARGARVVLGSRDAARAGEAAAAIGADVEAVAVDITADASVARAAEWILGRHGRLDVLVNNAAILMDHYQGLAELEPSMLERTFATNVVGTFRVTRAMWPLLERSDEPRIINVSSGAGQLDGEPQAWAPAYSISKTALNMLTQQIAVALPGVMVNSMCPGWCRTEMGGPEAPLSPEDGADTLVWLALDAPPDLRGKFVKQRKVIPW